MTSAGKSRVARRAQPARPARGRRASPRALAAFGGIVALAVVATVFAVVLSGGRSAAPNVPAVGTLEHALPGAADVNALFSGIPQEGMRLGKASAPVTLIEYLDLQCPYCRLVETQLVPHLIARYVRTGEAKLVVRPLASLGPDSIRGREAMIAASRQNRAFNFAGLVYVNQGTENTGWLDDSLVAEAAASIPRLWVHSLLDARDSAGVAKLGAHYDALALIDDVKSTPTFFVGSSFGGRRKLLVDLSETSLSAAVDALLQP
jgi:protein-disulfide isomerase